MAKERPAKEITRSVKEPKKTRHFAYYAEGGVGIEFTISVENTDDIDKMVSVLKAAKKDLEDEAEKIEVAQ